MHWEMVWARWAAGGGWLWGRQVGRLVGAGQEGRSREGMHLVSGAPAGPGLASPKPQSGQGRAGTAICPGHWGRPSVCLPV